MRASRVTAVIAPAVVAGFLASGCGLLGGGDTGLAAALDEVAARGPAAQYLEYGNFAELRRLGIMRADGTSPPRWNPVAGSGAAPLAPAARKMAGPTGISVFSADRAVTIGRPPHAATRLDGDFDADAITAKLRALGARPRTIGGQDGLSFGRDYVIDLKGRQPDWGLLNQLNQVVPTGSYVAAGPGADAVAAALGTGDTLASDDDHAAMADCLGDVVAATITAPRSASAAAALVAIGVRTPEDSGAAAVDVVCALPKGGDPAAVARLMRTRLAPGATLSASNEPLSRYAGAVTHDQADAHGRTVLRTTLTMRADAPAYLAEQMLDAGGLGFLTG